MKFFAALFFTFLLTLASSPVQAADVPAGVDCSVWEGIDCASLADSLKAGSKEFTEDNIQACRVCNEKPKPQA